MVPDAGLGSTAMGASGISLREITDQNREAVAALRVAASQERYVSSVADSLDEARDTPEGNPWYRAIYADDQPVGFVMLSWNVTPDPPQIIGPWFLWKLLIDERHQGRGYGREAVKLVSDIARGQGASELLTSYVAGERSPESFYRQIGFVPTGEEDEKGEKVLALRLRN
jgi:diamine N-acetyltransferase